MSSRSNRQGRRPLPDKQRPTAHRTSRTPRAASGAVWAWLGCNFATLALSRSLPDTHPLSTTARASIAPAPPGAKCRFMVRLLRLCGRLFTTRRRRGASMAPGEHHRGRSRPAQRERMRAGRRSAPGGRSVAGTGADRAPEAHRQRRGGKPTGRRRPLPHPPALPASRASPAGGFLSPSRCLRGPGRPGWTRWHPSGCRRSRRSALRS